MWGWPCLRCTEPARVAHDVRITVLTGRRSCTGHRLEHPPTLWRPHMQNHWTGNRRPRMHPALTCRANNPESDTIPPYHKARPEHTEHHIPGVMNTGCGVWPLSVSPYGPPGRLTPAHTPNHSKSGSNSSNRRETAERRLPGLCRIITSRRGAYGSPPRRRCQMWRACAPCAPAGTLCPGVPASPSTAGCPGAHRRTALS